MDCCSKKVLAAVYTEDERADLDVDTNIISITFSDVAEKQMSLDSSTPVSCNFCQAILSNSSTVYEHDEYKVFASQILQNHPEEEYKMDHSKGNPPNSNDIIPFDKLVPNQKIWLCDFCGKHNVLPLNFISLPKINDVFYGKSNATNQKEEKLELPFKKNTEQDQSIIFCIDNSGSMSGTNLNCVRNAVSMQINDLQSKYPKKKVGLVAFESSVRVYGDCWNQYINLPSDSFENFDACLNFGVGMSESSLSHSVADSLAYLQTALKSVSALGATALGPGLLVSLGLVMNSNPGSMIILCTDGMANQGVGTMQRKDADDFYRKVGKLAKDKGVMISVLTIKGGECKVEKLALLTDMTGGMVSRIKPTRIGKDFGKAMQGEMIGTEANLRLQLHRALCFKNEDEAFVSNEPAPWKKNSIITKVLGNVINSTEETFEFRFKSKGDLAKMGIKLEELNQLPIQAQINYVNLDGVQILRVLTLKLEVSKMVEEVKKNANVKIIAMRAAHDVAKEADQGNLVTAKKKFDKWDGFLEDDLKSFNKEDPVFQKYYQVVKTKNEALQKQLNKNIARKIKKKDKKVMADMDDLSDDCKKGVLKCIAANSSEGSSDECEANLKKFAKKRQASYENLSCEYISDDGKNKGKKINSDSDSDNHKNIKRKKSWERPSMSDSDDQICKNVLRQNSAISLSDDDKDLKKKKKVIDEDSDSDKKIIPKISKKKISSALNSEDDYASDSKTRKPREPL